MSDILHELIKSTIEYRNGLIDFSIKDKNRITVWSKDSSYGYFYSPGLANAFKIFGYGSICCYNSVLERVELDIYKV